MRRFQVEYPEYPFGGSRTLHTGMVMCAQGSKGKIKLRREQEHKQAELKRHHSLDQSYSDLDSNECDAYRCGEFEHHTGEERYLEYFHRNRTETFAGFSHFFRLIFTTAENLESLQSLQCVQKVRRHPAHCFPLPAGYLLGVCADKPHEKRDQRTGDHQHYTAQKVDVQDKNNNDNGYSQNRDCRRNVARVVIVQFFDSLHCRRDKLACLFTLDVCRTEVKKVRKQTVAETGFNMNCTALGIHFTYPGQNGTKKNRTAKQDYIIVK